MVWTAPSTKSIGGNISTADWNTFVRDNLEALVERPTCRLIDGRTTASSYEVNTATNTIVRWFDEEWDSHNLHDNAANQSRVTVPSGWAGVWLVCATLSFGAGDPDGYRRVRLLVNGTDEWAQTEEIPATGSARTAVCCTGLVNMNVGDFLQVEVYQDSGSQLALLGDVEDDELGCSLAVMYMGEATASSDAFAFTGDAGKTDPADWWNDEVVGSFRRLRRRPMCRASSAATSTSASSWVTASLAAAEQFDTDTMHNTGANQSRLTATRSGYYLAVGQANFASGGDDRVRSMRWAINGTGTGNISTSKPTTYASYSMQNSLFQYLNAGDYVELQTWQASGGALNVSAWAGMVWMGESSGPAFAQRIEGPWDDDPYAGGAQAGIIPRPWVNVHTRELPGLVYAPPIVSTLARFTRDISVREWKKVKYNRQLHDPWNLVKGRRNFGEKFVVPKDGVYAVAAQVNIKDDPVVSAKFTVKTTTFTVDTATDVVTATGHGFRNRAEVTVGSTATLPGGLLGNGNPYHVRRIDDNSFTLHPTRADAANNTNTVNITTTGSGTHRVSNSMIQCRGLNLRTGMRVRVSSSGTLPLGLSGGTVDWFVIRVGPNKFRVASTEEASEDETYTILFDSGSGNHTVTVQEPYGSRGCRLVHNGEVVGGWLGAPGFGFNSCRPAITLVAAQAEDELWVEAITTGPEGSRITAQLPRSVWTVAWSAPWAYTGAVPVADRNV
jgi:hypothetical protein